MVLLLQHRTRGRGSFPISLCLLMQCSPSVGKDVKELCHFPPRNISVLFCCIIFYILLHLCILLARNKAPRNLEYNSQFVYPYKYFTFNKCVVCAGSNANLCKVMQSGVQYSLHHSTVEDFTIREFTWIVFITICCILYWVWYRFWCGSFLAYPHPGEIII